MRAAQGLVATDRGGPKMANYLAELYSSSAPMSLTKFTAALDAETDPSKLADLSRRIEALKTYDSQNLARRSFWEQAAIHTARRLGDALAEMQKSGNLAKQGRPPKKGIRVLPLLNEIGLSKIQASRAKQLAAIPEEKVEQYFEQAKESGDEITKAGLLRTAKPKKPAKPTAPKPAPEPPEPEPDDAGGWEPHEADKPLAKLKKTLSLAARQWGEAKKVHGGDDRFKAIFAGIDAATKSLTIFLDRLKKLKRSA